MARPTVSNWKLLQPEKLAVDPQATNAVEEWKFWFETFNNFLNALPTPGTDQPAYNKLHILTANITAPVYKYISDANSYEDAIEKLKDLYDKPKNEIFARHLLAIAHQENGESLDEFVLRLNQLAKDCNFVDVTANEYQQQMKRDSLISGIASNFIRQRLLENKTLTFSEAYDQARSLDIAKRNADDYSHVPETHSVNAVCSDEQNNVTSYQDRETTSSLNAFSKGKNFICFFCGGKKRHMRNYCPAKDAICNYCKKEGHFAKCCMSKDKKPISASVRSHALATLTNKSSPFSENVMSKVKLNGIVVDGLIDTGSTDSYVNYDVIDHFKLPFEKYLSTVSMANTSYTADVLGKCIVDLELNGQIYHKFCLSVMKDLTTDVIIGEDLLKTHKSVKFNFCGNRPELNICATLPTANTEFPSLFKFLSSDCKPIAIPPRKFCSADNIFIENEVSRLLNEGRIEKCNSPWRAQPFVANNREKKRMVIDYSQTINRYTFLDAYPLPSIESIINEVASWNYISTLDLRSAYHQVKIRPEDKPYTAFQVGKELYQWNYVPFGLTNAVPGFQRVINRFIARHKLKGVNAYLDNISVGGKTKKEHDINLAALKKAAAEDSFTFNEDKSQYCQTAIRLLGYEVGHGSLKPDSDRIAALQKIPVPSTRKELQHIVGLFAYYAKWIQKYSELIRPLTTAKNLPLTGNALQAFSKLKEKLISATLQPIDEAIPFTVETDASDFAISATLNQNGKPVAFHARTLSRSEQKHSSIEKEAYAIVEALRKWRHLLVGRHFTLVTDQKCVSFMLDKTHVSKIKNDKIQRWRLELSEYDYTTIYRPGDENKAADTLSRSISAAVSRNPLFKLKELHDNLCHPGTTRMMHFIRSKNLPYTLSEVKNVVSMCKDCAEIKPNFYQPDKMTLIKATQPFERINIDFKGPLESNTANKYILTIIDEYTRFPFAYACPNMKAKTVVDKLSELFCIFGLPSYIHSDQGSSFMSYELKDWLHSKGVATSRTTRYNPRGNSQTERLNATLFNTVKLCLRTKNLPITCWEEVLSESLHAIRSLLCTSINCTPHERMFYHNRKSSNGVSIPSWIKPGAIFVKRHVRNKTDPLVDEAELLEVNPSYAHVRLENGREITVSLRDLAPNPDCPTSGVTKESTSKVTSELELSNETKNDETIDTVNEVSDSLNELPTNTSDTSPVIEPRSSGRARRPVERYGMVPYF